MFGQATEGLEAACMSVSSKANMCGSSRTLGHLYLPEADAQLAASAVAAVLAAELLPSACLSPSACLPPLACQPPSALRP